MSTSLSVFLLVTSDTTSEMNEEEKSAAEKDVQDKGIIGNWLDVTYLDNR
jgi:hypothetical protein